MTGVLYLVVCAAGPAPCAGMVVEQATARGWDVCVIGTPAAVDGGFVEVGHLTALAGRPVRHRYRRADEPGRWPRADAVAVAPCTVNTLTKWADGHADTYALGVLTESIGLGVPVAALPFWNEAQAAHPAVDRAVSILRGAGVDVLYGPGGFEPHPPGTGGRRTQTYPWHLVLDAVDSGLTTDES